MELVAVLISYDYIFSRLWLDWNEYAWVQPCFPCCSPMNIFFAINVKWNVKVDTGQETKRNEYKNWFFRENKRKFHKDKQKLFQAQFTKFPQTHQNDVAKQFDTQKISATTCTHTDTGTQRLTYRLGTLLCDLAQTCYPCHILCSSRLTDYQSIP